MIESGILFALLAFLGFGIGDVFATHLSRRLTAFQLSSMLLIFTILLYGAFGILFAPNQFIIPNGISLVYTIAAGASATVALLSFFKGLSVARAGVVVPIANSYALVSVFLSVLVLGNVLSLLQWLAVMMVVINMFALSANWSELQKFDRNLFFPLVSFFCWGFMTFFMDQALAQGGTPLSLVLAIDFFVLIVVTLYLVFTRSWNLHTITVRDWLLGWAMAWILGGSFLAFAYGFSIGSLGIIAVIATASPLLTAILSHIFLGDKLKYYQYGFIVMIIAGIALLSV